MRYQHKVVASGTTSSQKLLTLTLQQIVQSDDTELVVHHVSETSSGKSLHYSQSSPQLQGIWSSRNPFLNAVTIPEGKGLYDMS